MEHPYQKKILSLVCHFTPYLATDPGRIGWGLRRIAALRLRGRLGRGGVWWQVYKCMTCTCLTACGGRTGGGSEGWGGCLLLAGGLEGWAGGLLVAGGWVLCVAGSWALCDDSLLGRVEELRLEDTEELLPLSGSGGSEERESGLLPPSLWRRDMLGSDSTTRLTWWNSSGEHPVSRRGYSPCLGERSSRDCQPVCSPVSLPRGSLAISLGVGERETSEEGRGGQEGRGGEGRPRGAHPPSGAPGWILCSCTLANLFSVTRVPVT